MKEKLLEELVKLIQESKGLLAENLPQIAQDLLNYSAWSSQTAIWVYMGIIIFFQIPWVILIKNKSDTDQFYAYGILDVFILLTCIGCICSNVFEIKRIKMTPKTYVIEKVLSWSKE